jgi:hypothetical protein
MFQRTTPLASLVTVVVGTLVLAAASAGAEPLDEQQSVWSITTSLVLAWDPPEGRRPISYIVEAGTRPGLSDVAVFDTGNSLTSVYVASVPPGTYYARVRARSASGVSDPSNEITINAGGSFGGAESACPPPHPPTGLSSTIDASTVAVRWTGSAGATSYYLEAGSTPGASDVFSGNVGNETAVQAVVPSGNYFVRVRAVSSCGSSAPSGEIGFGVGSRE